MLSHTRRETWLLPNGQQAEIEIEVHHDGSEVVPVQYELFTQMAGDLGFKIQPTRALPTPVVAGNYLDPSGLPVNATRAPAPDDPNVIGGYASARAWCVRWIKAAADVEVFSDSRDALMWDHGRTRHVLLPGEWVAWDGNSFRVLRSDEFADFSPVNYPTSPEGERA